MIKVVFQLLFWSLVIFLFYEGLDLGLNLLGLPICFPQLDLRGLFLKSIVYGFLDTQDTFIDETFKVGIVEMERFGVEGVLSLSIQAVVLFQMENFLDE